MAIEKMKKLRLMAVRSQKEDILRDLMLLDCVEVTEPEKIELEPAVTELVSRESSELTRYKADQTGLYQAIGLLDKYAPVKGSFLAPKPEVACEEILDDSGLESAMNLADEIISRDDRIKRAAAEKSRIRTVIESLTPWQKLDVPLECSGTESCSVMLGGIPAAAEFETVKAKLNEAVEESELAEVSADKDQHYVAVVCMKNDQQAALESLREFGFTVTSFAGLKGTAAENMEKLAADIKSLEEEETRLVSEIAAYGDKRDELKLSADRMGAKISCAEAEDRLYGMNSAVALQGWVVAKKLPEVEACLEKYDCAWEVEEPAEEEYPEVPIKLTNNKITNSLNMVTNMYSLPTYDGVDPNPLMAPFFILFYGLMMADMGYGLLMIIAAIVVLMKKKPVGGTLVFFQLMLYAGISTFIMGICTASFFGDFIAKLGTVLGHDNWGMPWKALFDPMNDTMTILIGAMGLGLIHLNAGMLINFVEKCKNGQFLDGLFEEGAQWVVLVGAVLFAMPMLGVGGDGMKQIGKWILIVGLVLLFYGGSRSSKGVFGKLLSIFVTVYNQATGWLGDLLSYSRIMALMLAGAVIASVFNTIGTMLGNVVGYMVIFFIGHTLNFLLNLLSCYVHDLRLQCLEYFGKFYKDGGRKFEPISINPKYYEIKN